MTPTRTKLQVKYRITKKTAFRKCGNCVMFQRRTIASGCTLVKGVIESYYVCDEWKSDE